MTAGGFAGALGLAVLALAGPCAAGLSAQYGSDDPHVDQLLGQCRAQFDAYARVLGDNNPPENVYFTIRSFITSLRAPSQWSPAELEQRQAIADRTVRAPPQVMSNDPAAPTAALLAQCVVGAEGRTRQGHGAGPGTAVSP